MCSYCLYFNLNITQLARTESNWCRLPQAPAYCRGLGARGQERGVSTCKPSGNHSTSLGLSVLSFKMITSNLDMRGICQISLTVIIHSSNKHLMNIKYYIKHLGYTNVMNDKVPSWEKPRVRVKTDIRTNNY